MTKKKNIPKSITLCIQELMRISMECLPLGVLCEGLYSDFLIRVTAALLSHRCESGPGKHIDGLKDSRTVVTEHILDGFI